MGKCSGSRDELHRIDLLVQRRHRGADDRTILAQGIGADGRPRSGVLEPSWRVGGASSAEIAALAAFARAPSLDVVRASHVEEFGTDRRAPADAIIDFQGGKKMNTKIARYFIIQDVRILTGSDKTGEPSYFARLRQRFCQSLLPSQPGSILIVTALS